MNSEKTPAQVLSEMNAGDSCSTHFNERTHSITLDNRTQAEVVLWLVQGIDESGTTPPDFARDTGVFVGETNGPANSKYEVDPCTAGGGHMPVQATRVRSSMKLRYNGEEFDFHNPDVVARKGEFVLQANFGIAPADILNHVPDVSISSEFSKKSG